MVRKKIALKDIDAAKAADNSSLKDFFKVK
jgi:hypothetical protein